MLINGSRVVKMEYIYNCDLPVISYWKDYDNKGMLPVVIHHLVLVLKNTCNIKNVKIIFTHISVKEKV